MLSEPRHGEKAGINFRLVLFFRSTKRFGPEARRFEHLAFLNFAQNVVCFVWSFISERPLPPFRAAWLCSYISRHVVVIDSAELGVDRARNISEFVVRTNAVIKLWSGGSSSAGRAPLWKYWGVSVTNTIGPTMGIEALKYISYPAQVWLWLPFPSQLPSLLCELSRLPCS